MAQEEKIRKIIFKLFALFIFLVPLVLTPWNSELFEFNKTILTYFFTSLIFGFWLARMVIAKKIIFRHSPFDLPLVVFLFSQIISTVFSIHPYTSIWGYYSRFHQGLLLSISYLILFWAAVSNLNKNETRKILTAALVSGLLVAFWGILERLGIDKNYWVQDVQNRVFSTLGQPNWLAAYLNILIFVNFFFLFSAKNTPQSKPPLYSKFLSERLISAKGGLASGQRLRWNTLNSLLYLCLLFTRSRSGFAGFAAGLATIYLFGLINRSLKKILQSTLPWLAGIVMLTIIFSAPFDYNLKDILRMEPPQSELVEISETPSSLLITPSQEIRKIVWQGALDLWKKYPIFGTGTETFAYTYYWVRSAEHNLTSEWDFLYNKAHNEYLNFAANNGIFGLVAYLLLPIIYLFWGVKKLGQSKENWILIGLLAAFVSILVTNFFGFSVTVVGIWFYLLPAFSFLFITSPQSPGQKLKQKKPKQAGLNKNQKITLSLIFLFTGWLVIKTGQYWLADFYYKQAQKQQAASRYQEAIKAIQKSLNLRKKEAIYWSQAAELNASIAFLVHQTYQDKNDWQSFAQKAVEADQRALVLNPFHLNLYKQSAKNFYILSKIDPQFLNFSLNNLLKAINLAPTDAKLYYNAGLMYQALGDKSKGRQYLEKAVELKANYEAARMWLGQMYLEDKETQKAEAQFKFILEKINPQNEEAKKLLEKI